VRAAGRLRAPPGEFLGFFGRCTFLGVCGSVVRVRVSVGDERYHHRPQSAGAGFGGGRVLATRAWARSRRVGALVLGRGAIEI